MNGAKHVRHNTSTNKCVLLFLSTASDRQNASTLIHINNVFFNYYQILQIKSYFYSFEGKEKAKEKN